MGGQIEFGTRMQILSIRLIGTNMTITTGCPKICSKRNQINACFRNWVPCRLLKCPKGPVSGFVVGIPLPTLDSRI